MKNKNILLMIFIFIVIFSIIIIRLISDLDEIWNYNTARAISEGLIPYKDISMITTPLLPMITSIFLKLVVNEVMISRILAACIWTGILFTIYKILEQLVKEENTCLIVTTLVGILCRDIYCIDYNVTILLLALIILYEELKNIENVQKHNKKYDFIIGIIAGLAICTKQSIGATLALVVVLYKILFVENKEQFKQYIKIAITRIIGILIPIIFLFLYLVFTGAILEFINYAILGISTFSNKSSYMKLLNDDKIEIKILSMIVPISMLLMPIVSLINKKSNKEKSIRLLTILMYSLSIVIVMYPIADKIHFLIGSIITIIGIIYMLFLLVEKIYNKIRWTKKYKIYKILTLLMWLIMFSFTLNKSINNIYTYLNMDKNQEINHYKNIRIEKYLENRINNIDTYILEKEKEGKKVYILDSEAALYMIPINKYNKDYDMFLKGNIGKDGEDGQIQRIKERDKNNIYLIRNRKIENNWQIPQKVIKYVRENLEKIEEIEIYEVYK